MFLVYNRAENSRTTTSLIIYTALDWAYRGNETRKAIFNRYFETAIPQLLLALLQCFNRFAASLVSGAHTRFSSTSTVCSTFGKLLFTLIIWGNFPSCAAFGIHRLVYFIQTLEAMFDASITAKKMGRFFIYIYILQTYLLVSFFTTPKGVRAKNKIVLVSLNVAIADHDLYLVISVRVR